MFRFKTFLEQTDMTHAKNKDNEGLFFVAFGFAFAKKGEAFQ